MVLTDCQSFSSHLPLDKKRWTLLVIIKLLKIRCFRHLDIIIITNLTAKAARVLTKGLPFLSSRILLENYRQKVFTLFIKVLLAFKVL